MSFWNFFWMIFGGEWWCVG